MSVARRASAVGHTVRGWAVFPCGTPTDDHGHPAGSASDCERCKAEKAPRRGWKWKERNSNDRAVISAHWPKDDPNLGVACRASGLVVVDLDTAAHGAVIPPDWAAKGGIHEGADVLAYRAEEAGQPYPFETYTVRTSSGGWHLYFQAPPDRAIPNSAGKIGPMVDVRGTANADGQPGGGYVLGAGSIVGGAQYTVLHDVPPMPLPGWIADLAAPTRPVPAVRRPIPARSNGEGRPHSRFVGLLDTVLSAPNGQRNNVLHWAACRAADMVAEGIVDQAAAVTALERAGESIGLGQREASATIGSAFRTAA
ncbi:bifunctional DNA primase/polymerase [Spirillospora sp. NPDC048911]|uniref:bifunctional DNA primase/polymerase n=1 Tax=Spirillospora sp. NPDC048911 TaxID=3364527 RepID=UPI003714BAA9